MRRAPARLDPHWQFRSTRPGRAELAWLRDSGSLTARLQQRAGGRLQVRVTRLGFGRPTLAERRALALPAGQVALLREVVLHRGDADWVVARSVIPLATLAGANRRLRHLGNRPLGAFLFRDPGLRRSRVTVRRLDTGPHAGSWGRCSTFLLRGQPLLVAEYFLPALLTPPPL